MSLLRVPWLISGQAIFGLLIGLMVGLSASPIVNTTVGLLFAFIGGSIVFLIKDRSDEDLNTIGVCVFVMSFFIIIGGGTGMYLRLGNPFDIEPSRTAYKIDHALTFDEIKTYGKKEGYGELICNLIVTNGISNHKDKINKQEVIDLIFAGVNTKVIGALLNNDYFCSDSVTAKVDSGGFYLQVD